MWLKKAPVNLFSLALLIAALYFTIFATNPYAIGAFVFLLLCFFKHHWKNNLIYLPLLKENGVKREIKEVESFPYYQAF